MNNWMPQTSKNLLSNNRVNRVPPKLLLFLKSQLQMGSHSNVFCLGSPRWGCQWRAHWLAGRQSSARAPPWGPSGTRTPLSPTLQPLRSRLPSFPGLALAPGGGSVFCHLILPGSELWYRRKNVFS